MKGKDKLRFQAPLFSLLLLCALPYFATAQLVINEGSNKNYNTISDEDSENPDWIEIHNAAATDLDLTGYTLTDNEAIPDKWPLPSIVLPAGEFLVIFCSGKDRYETPAFTPTVTSEIFTPTVGWNTHSFTNPFYWDGLSNIVINVCSYRSAGYTINSIFNQTDVGFLATRMSFEDGSPAACSHNTAITSSLRPNVQINGQVLGTGTIQNGPTDYPAPYGNWYYGARHQFLFLAAELSAAGIAAGNIESLAFNVASTDPTTYDYIDVSINNYQANELDNYFLPAGGFSYHTNFKIKSNGENVFLFNPGQQLQSSLDVDAGSYNVSVGSFTDAAVNIVSFAPPTPGASNNQSIPYTEYAEEPGFTVNSGIYNSTFTVEIINPNPAGSDIYYTTDGSEPELTSMLYDGNPIQVTQTSILKARAFESGKLPSPVAAVSYLFNIEHNTPIISVITDNNNLYGAEGIFDNAAYDWLRPAHIQYFDETPSHPLVFSQMAGIQVDGGAGGSRFHPQTSFRIELDNGLFGEGPIEHLVNPYREGRTTWSDFYLRNGSNQYLVLPYKDAAQVRILGNKTNSYYSEWRPATVYINGAYHGLYELREKFNKELFQFLDDATPNTIEILSLSYWNGGILRAIEGEVDNYWNAHDQAITLNVNAADYWEQTDEYYDLDYYHDYIIGQVWMGNVDWPQNNIKIYRSDATDYRWRFCTIDQELALQPNGWTDCYSNTLGRLFWEIGDTNPYTDIWYKSLQNDRFRNYFINRFADVMNTSYASDQLLAIEQDMFDQTFEEMANEYARWGDPNNVPGQMNAYYNNHLVFRNELLCRSEQVRNHIASQFELPQQVQLTLDVFPADAGTIKISTIIPETYPWQGVYFDGVPVQIEAIPNVGYEFLAWDENDLISNVSAAIFNDTLQTDAVTFTANFGLITGVNTVNQNKNKFRLYPTLADNEVQIVNNSENTGSAVTITIFDIQGKTLQQSNWNPGTTQMSIKVAALPSAVYYLSIQNSFGIVDHLKFVKK
jgi:CotH kinase protein/Chitobiase/beta-hexosaminidase C-terminal domain/Secretion system C-terminal sorting domain